MTIDNGMTMTFFLFFFALTCFEIPVCIPLVIGRLFTSTLRFLEGTIEWIVARKRGQLEHGLYTWVMDERCETWGGEPRHVCTLH